MKIWTSEHVFNHSWESVTEGQWQKYPNPHNQAVVGIDVVERKVLNGVLHSHRLISSDWGLAEWAQKILGSNRVCYASEYSTVDPRKKIMQMNSRNITFCNIVNIDEMMTYKPHPTDSNKTLMKQETVVTVQGVPLTSYMESIIVNSISNNSNKGRVAIDWIVDKLGQECRALSVSSYLDKLKADMVELKSTVADSLILPARKSIDDLQARVQVELQSLGNNIHSPAMLKAEDFASAKTL